MQNHRNGIIFVRAVIIFICVISGFTAKAACAREVDPSSEDRHSIAISAPATGVYAVMRDPLSVENPCEEGFDQLAFCASSVGEDMGGGKLRLVIRYRISQGNPFESPVPPTSDECYHIVEEMGENFFIPSDSPATFAAALSKPVPLWATDVCFYLVYKGKIGSEEDAAAAGFKDISEPTPLWVFNAMDKICLFSQIYKAGSPDALSAVDNSANGGDENGEDNEYGTDPIDISELTYSFSPAGTPLFTLAAGDHFTPFALLTDYEFDVGYAYMTSSGSESGESRRSGIKNQYEASSSLNMDSQGQVRKFPTFVKFRDVFMYGGSTLIHIIRPYPEGGSSCPLPAYDY
ncbi:hypothetical protein [Desulfonema magnum]|uniref:Uncharacterized protein n=1 Tax=Desulfonema magnum TaxID=45655 RepID=A0A975BF24_9BACT|nr:hypothetical protein [Desulfonema magnum]QTA84123.1 Uncharacterized protein dnm_001160 [Desulfonema magnum]